LWFGFLSFGSHRVMLGAPPPQSSARHELKRLRIPRRHVYVRYLRLGDHLQIPSVQPALVRK
jgi:hypothetical protein